MGGPLVTTGTWGQGVIDHKYDRIEGHLDQQGDDPQLQELPCGERAVSYTHLDVYKRQVESLSTEGFLRVLKSRLSQEPKVKACFYIDLGSCTFRFCVRRLFVDKSIGCCAPGMAEDVYKRQVFP